MLKIILLIVFTCLVMVLAPNLADGQGFIHISIGEYVVQTSLVAAVIIYLVSLVLILAVISCVKKIIAMPKGTLRIFKRRSAKKKLSLIDSAVVLYEIGEFEQALNCLKKANPLEKSDEKTLLFTAKVAYALKNYEYTSKVLDEATKRGGQCTLASNIMRAKLNLDAGNAKAAIEYLDKLKGSVRNTRVLNLYLKSYLKLKNADAIKKIEDDLAKYRVLEKSEFIKLEAKLLKDELVEVDEPKELENIYKKVKKVCSSDGLAMSLIAHKFITSGQKAKANQLVLGYLKRKVDKSILNGLYLWDEASKEILDYLKANAIKEDDDLYFDYLKAIANLELNLHDYKSAISHFNKALELDESADLYLKLALSYLANQNTIQAQQNVELAKKFFNQISLN